MKTGIFFIICLIFISCNRYLKYPNYNKKSSTIDIVVEGVKYPDKSSDSALIHFNFYVLSKGIIKKISTKHKNVFEFIIDKKVFPIDSTGQLDYNSFYGIKRLQLKNKITSSYLYRNKIEIKKNVEYSISIYIIDDRNSSNFKKVP